MDSSEDYRAENDPWNFRSPFLDAHHEAFILRSSWTVGNLYAANLHLGQSYVKQVKDLEEDLAVKEREGTGNNAKEMENTRESSLK